MKGGGGGGGVILFLNFNCTKWLYICYVLKCIGLPVEFKKSIFKEKKTFIKNQSLSLYYPLGYLGSLKNVTQFGPVVYIWAKIIIIYDYILHYYIYHLLNYYREHSLKMKKCLQFFDQIACHKLTWFFKTLNELFIF